MMIVRSLAAVVLLLTAGVVPAPAQNNQQGNAPPPARPNVTPPLKLTTPAFTDGGTIPIKYTCSATTPPPSGPMQISLGVSPLLQWTNVPKGTASFVLILHDADAHIAKAFDDIPHWVVFNIPGDATQLAEGVPPDAPLANGTMQGNNMMRRAAYQGPCAPPGGAPHHYTFELYALDTKLDLPQGASRADIEKAMDGHVLSATVYIGLFSR
ncbi:MAG: YbhB/YbcL family Raf kinase inhibitor-like protein [Candidatus Acidiferrales bacterium]|jgi:Raf kinase inhibitor-like YbhB/YbcL family protein